MKSIHGVSVKTSFLEAGKMRTFIVQMKELIIECFGETKSSRSKEAPNTLLSSSNMRISSWKRTKTAKTPKSRSLETPQQTQFSTYHNGLHIQELKTKNRKNQSKKTSQILKWNKRNQLRSYYKYQNHNNNHKQIKIYNQLMTLSHNTLGFPGHQKHPGFQRHLGHQEGQRDLGLRWLTQVNQSKTPNKAKKMTEQRNSRPRKTTRWFHPRRMAHKIKRCTKIMLNNQTPNKR